MAEKSPPCGAGSFCWTELLTRDMPAACAFYSKLVGWELQEQDMGGFKYTMMNQPGVETPVGGMMSIDDPKFEGVPPHWLPYLQVDDVDAKAAQCKELGGQVIAPPMDIPNNIGRFCVIQDPTGAVIALFQTPKAA